MEDVTGENNQHATLIPTKKESSRGQNASEGHLTVDVYQTQDDIVVRSAIAGARLEDIDIQVTKDQVVIKGQRKPEEHIDPQSFFHRELHWGSFSRAIILPVDVEPDGAKASYKNSVLTVRLPKLEKSGTKKLKISG